MNRAGDQRLLRGHWAAQLNAQLDASNAPAAQTTNEPPTTEELKDRLQGFVDSNHHTALSQTQLDAVDELSDNERRMFDATMDELDRLQNEEIDASDYMTNIMQHAADIAGDDGNEFVALTGMAMSVAPANDYWQGGEFQRRLAGAGGHEAGAILENIHASILDTQGGSTEATGFNPNIIDTRPESTVTHHFGEFLRAGANRWDWVARSAQNIIDDVETNPGDVRNGYFAIMLGDAASDGTLSPDDAVKLTSWAFDTDAAVAPPWGTQDTGTHTSGGDYKIKDWIAAYNEAFPNDTIGE